MVYMKSEPTRSDTLHTHSFYTIEEYLSLLWIKNGIIRSYYSSILIFSSIV